jgi:uncharacterized protein (TIGR03118 family)
MSCCSGVIRYLAAAGALLAFPMASFAQNYAQTNLVSDIPQPANANGSAVIVDPNLRNAWGLARGAATPWWVNNAGTGTSTLYSGAGATQPLVVTVPNVKGATGPSAPTGMVFNGTADFAIAANNPAAFIFATANGTIAAWGPPATPVTAGKSTAITEVDESKAGAVFTGLTWIENDGAHFLLAANFSQDRIEAFDANYRRVSLADMPFRDDRVPSGFAPYNVQAVGATVVVTYAKQSRSKTSADDNCGEQCGFVGIFTTTGKFLSHLESGP